MFSPHLSDTFCEVVIQGGDLFTRNTWLGWSCRMFQNGGTQIITNDAVCGSVRDRCRRRFQTSARTLGNRRNYYPIGLLRVQTKKTSWPAYGLNTPVNRVNSFLYFALVQIFRVGVTPRDSV